MKIHNRNPTIYRIQNHNSRGSNLVVCGISREIAPTKFLRLIKIVRKVRSADKIVLLVQKVTLNMIRRDGWLISNISRAMNLFTPD